MEISDFNRNILSLNRTFKGKKTKTINGLRHAETLTNHIKLFENQRSFCNNSNLDVISNYAARRTSIDQVNAQRNPINIT